MTVQDKNIAIAEMLGATQEQWYPPNKDTKQTGIHLAFPQGSWYPDNKRYHTDSLLKFHSDANWQMEACKFITKTYDTAWKITSKFCEIHNHNNGFDCRYDINCPENPMLDIFECLYYFSLYIKEK